MISFNKKILFVLVILFLIPLATSTSYKQNSIVELRHSVVSNGTAPTSLDVNITVWSPDGSILVPFKKMSYSSASNDFNYTLPAINTTKTGTYTYTVYVCTLSECDSKSFEFDITPSGDTGLAVYYFIIIGLVYLIMIIGLYKGDITITMFGTMGLYLVGIWMLFYGIDIYKNWLTEGFAIISLGMAAYCSVKVAQEYIII